MSGRTYRAYGQRYNLKPECKLDAEDFRKLATLAKLEKEVAETRLAMSQTNVVPEVKQLVQALTRQEWKVKRLREELKEVLA